MVEITGKIGEKIHTARSRNDQIVLDEKMYLKDSVNNILFLITKYQISLLKLSEKVFPYIFTAYTHLQQAQPLLLSHYLIAHIEMAERDKERFVYEKLQNITLSKEAQDVIDAATKLTIDSFPYRKLEQMAGHDPDWHLHAWDAGYAQLKLLWKKYYKKEFDEFRKLYKILEDKLIPQVYELGFLRDE